MDIGRRIWPWIGLLLLVAVTASVVWFLFYAPRRESAGTLVAALAAVMAVVGPVAVRLLKQVGLIRGGYLPLDHAADELAKQVRQQWERAAGERGLMSPTPISLRWRWSRWQVTGPVTAAVARARFAPLPSMAPITAEQLGSGTIGGLFGLYGGLGSGRLMILGGPGAGKSGAAILLLLQALTHRSTFGAAKDHRASVPVPVLFTLHGWDPHSQRLSDWLASRLTADYPLLRAPEYGRNCAARLIGGGYIAVILDGLDEVAEVLRPTVLRALDEQAIFRLVLLSRSEEMAAAVGEGHLRGAAALELCAVDAGQVAEYLASAQIDPAPASWQRLVDHLRDYPHGALAQALETPLMVTLVRDTYRTNDPVDELIDIRQFTSREAIENHLLDRVLPVAYTQRPGHPAPLYTLDQARRWLGNLARRMNAEGTRDLAWWQIQHWVPAWPRVLATVLACELVVGLVIVSGVRLSEALVNRFELPLPIVLPGGWTGTLVSKLGIALTIGLVIGFMGAFGERPPRYLIRLRRSETKTSANLMIGLVYGLISGLIGGIFNSFANGVVHGLVFGIAVGIVAGSSVALMGTFGERHPRHLSQLRWSKTYLVIGFAVGLAVGIIYVIMVGGGFANGLAKDSTNGLDAGILAWFLVWLSVGLVGSLGRISTDATSPISPRSSWRRNHQLGLVNGLVTALAYGFGQSFLFGTPSFIVVSIMSGIALGMAVLLVYPATWQVTLANTQMWYRGESPAHFLRFLEDARDRQILRTVGQIYQFRHSRLQDRLSRL